MGEEKKAAAAKDFDKKKEKDAGAAPAGPQPIVLKVDLHCAGCAGKVRKAIKRAPGVESVTADTAAGKVVVTGPADATELKERIEARAKKPETVTLKIRLHCDGCIDRIKRRIYKIKGVKDVAIDAGKDLVKVTGTMDAAALPGYLRDKLSRTVDDKPAGAASASVAPMPMADAGMYQMPPHYGYAPYPPAPGGYYGAAPAPHPAGFYHPSAGGQYPPPPPPAYPYGASHLHAPQMFSDENPNACSVM
ncbi:hypothetical protein C2845_PM01G41380 [Panicum miliaceum]|uniref:HMA domain-containing protein n=1 Tax=Panicum miliaceum TaxID=4540 RepID=A0A3L6TJH9_PANMI|nr:hypothetical protein C2845_PM01G41380 [Panicum miliaceum]